jgi:hypothetical protein
VQFYQKLGIKTKEISTSVPNEPEKDKAKPEKAGAGDSEKARRVKALALDEKTSRLESRISSQSKGKKKDIESYNR